MIRKISLVAGRPFAPIHRFALVVAVACLALSPPRAAEAQLLPITGTVVDSTGAEIRGAEVTARTRDGREWTTRTDFGGRFTIDVPSASARVTVTFARFETVSVDIDGSMRNVRIVLNPEPLAEQVTVSAAAPSVRIASATRTDTPLRDVPQAVSIITRDLIADQAMQSMADVVRYVPGVGMAQGEGHRDAPIFRGNTSTSDFFLDGIRDDTQYLRDLYNVERVEVLKGPNGMVFGRGGVGGVINRVTRQASWMPSRELSVQLGSEGLRRFTTDLGQVASERAAIRLTGLYESSDTYRRDVAIERYGANPTIALMIGAKTTLRAGYEHFHDDRTVDRGVPSYLGAPLVGAVSTFFGNADESQARVTVNGFSSSLEHAPSGRITLRNRLSYADYDKFYQNVFPGAVGSAGTTVSLSGYNTGTERRNLFNQTDLIVPMRTGRLEHTFVAGTELGRQVTDNLRLTAYFTSIGPTTTAVTVPVSAPKTSSPVEFRQNATDADNHGVAAQAAIYVQDQIAISRHVDAILGLRYDRFHVDLTNNRTASDVEGEDTLVSPRLGLVYKPIAPVALYGSYTLSYLPRAGEQLASLTVTNEALEPEEFRNYEVGAKWDITSALSFTAAIYRLNRGNVVVADPLDPTVSLLVDAQRTSGLELELGGRPATRWDVVAGYAYQRGEITRSISATVLAGARLGQVPAQALSVWNKVRLGREWGVGLGVIARSKSFVATDNAVVLPAFGRVDAAVFYSPAGRVGVQINVENLLDNRYYPTAHSNNNIMPGSPRAVRLALSTRF